LPAALVAEFAAHGITVHEGYGLTEAAPSVTLNRSGKAGSIGVALPGVEIQLRDQDGSLLVTTGDVLGPAGAVVRVSP